MVDFVAKATVLPPVEQVDPESVDEDVRAAVECLSKRTNEQVMKEREAAVKLMKDAAKELWANGAADEWLQRASDEVREVVKDVCGPLAELLAERTNFADKHCVDSFRKGAPLVGHCQRLLALSPMTMKLRCRSGHHGGQQNSATKTSSCL